MYDGVLYGCRTSKQELPNNGNLYTCKIFMAIFEFFGQFFRLNDVFKLQKFFSVLEIRVFLENGHGSFQTFFIL
jgi:hypothetical protein